MILQRLAKGLKEQDWITVLIEFLLVIFGVLIALEVDRYQEEQNKRGEEVRLLSAVQQELEQDMLDVDKLVISLTDINNFGLEALEIINTRGCIGNCWQNLVSIFHSTQWIDLAMSTTAYGELSQLGLPKNPDLKELLRQYYDMNKNRVIVGGTLPEYRKLIRSLIQPDMQAQMWKNCFQTQGRHQTLIKDCPTTTTEDDALEIVKLIQTTARVKMSLTFWLSNLSVSIIILPSQRAGAEALVVALEEEINR